VPHHLETSRQFGLSWDCATSSGTICNYFAITAAPLFKLTRQDSGYLSGPLPRAAVQAFQALQTQLSKQPALAFPRSDQNYLLITNAYTPDPDHPGGLCVTLAQKDEHDQVKIISHASRQLKENKKNYTKFLLEMAAAAWGMDNFNEYLKGSKFTLYKDQITEPNLGTRLVKMLNRLKAAMSEHHFETRNRQKSTRFLETRTNQHPPNLCGQSGKLQQSFMSTTFIPLSRQKKSL
jgi:hypothetical protein